MSSQLESERKLVQGSLTASVLLFTCQLFSFVLAFFTRWRQLLGLTPPGLAGKEETNLALVGARLDTSLPMGRVKLVRWVALLVNYYCTTNHYIT